MLLNQLFFVSVSSIYYIDTLGQISVLRGIINHYKDYLDMQSCRRVKGCVAYFKVGDIFSWVLDSKYADLEEFLNKWSFERNCFLKNATFNYFHCSKNLHFLKNSFSRSSIYLEFALSWHT